MGKEFAKAEGKRIELTNEQYKQIRDLYRETDLRFKERIRILSNRTNISSEMRAKYLNDFKKDIENEIKYLNMRIEGTIKNNMEEVAKAVVEDSNNLAKEMGFRGIFTSQYNIPKSAVEKVLTGKLYEGKWSLSKAIWSDNQKKVDDINKIVARGLLENKGAYDIAKDLERYVNPKARKDWNWSKVYPGTSKKIDYNAQRLARTMLSHAYQESFVESTKDNPFIESYRWLASGSDRMCDLCAERDGKIFSKDELPLDHPNGMCTFETVIEKSYDQIASDLHNWTRGEGDKDLNDQLDNYANELGYNIKDMTSVNPTVQDAKIPPESIDELNRDNFDGVAKSLGSKLTVDDIDDYVTSSYGNYELGDRISKLIDKLPEKLKVGDEDVYRGLYFNTEKELNNFVNNHQVGQIITTRRDGLSWTTDKNIAKEFSSNVSDYSVILVNSDDRKNAISIKEISDTLVSSSEVLYSSSTNFEVEEIVTHGTNITMYVTESVYSEEKY